MKLNLKVAIRGPLTSNFFRILISSILIFLVFCFKKSFNIFLSSEQSLGFETPQPSTFKKEDKKEIIISDCWYIVSYMGSQVGYSHILQKSILENNKKVFVTESNSYVELRVLDKKIVSKENSIFYEDENRRLIKFNSHIETPDDFSLINGIRNNNLLIISGKKRNGGEIKSSLNIEDVIFQSEILSLLKSCVKENKKTFFYRTFIPEFRKIINVDVEIRGIEEVDVNFSSKLLLEVTSKIRELGITTTEWYDEDFRLIKSETMGVESYLTEPENIIKSDFAQDLVYELGIKTDFELKNHHNMTKLELKFHNIDPSYFISDMRQEVSKEGKDTIIRTKKEEFAKMFFYYSLNGSTFLGTGTQVLRSPSEESFRDRSLSKEEQHKFYEKMSEYLANNDIIQSNDVEIISAAKKIIGIEKNPVKQVEMLKNWVFNNLQKVEFKHLFLSAKETLKLMQGDCTEHAVLLAALTRAVGIPSKIYVGIIYGGNGNWFYHMWTGVWLDEWFTVDAALNQFPADVTHLAFAETSFGKEEIDKIKISLPFLAFHKKVKIELISSTVNGYD